MSELETVRATPRVRTAESIARDLRALGVGAGRPLLVHGSLKAIGWVAGGAAAVIQALVEVVSPGGTLVMPAQSQDLSDPAGWDDPAIPAGWHDEVRRTIPAFDPRRTPTYRMGRIAELFRTWPDVLRSGHPTGSFAAWGRHAVPVTRDQPLGDPFGVASPLARLYDADADVLLLGVTFESCTALHLAERRAWPLQATVPHGSPMVVDGARQWVSYAMPLLRAELLDGAEAWLANEGFVRKGEVGSARSRLMSMRRLVDAGTRRWRPEG